jgi:hypothetical protein
LFSSKSVYDEIMNPGVRDVRTPDLSNGYMPMKIKIFVWMCFRGGANSSKTDLKAKGWPGNPSCSVRGEFETANHIILGCPLSLSLSLQLAVVKRNFGLG